jgi:hypothetical protein
MGFTLARPAKTPLTAPPREKERHTWRWDETAAPTGASIFRAGVMMTPRSDSKTSRQYLAGLPQTQLPAFGFMPIH